MKAMEDLDKLLDSMVQLIEIQGKAGHHNQALQKQYRYLSCAGLSMLLRCVSFCCRMRA